MLWERTGAFRALKQGLATFSDAIDRIGSGRVPARCKFGDHLARTVLLEVSGWSGDIVDVDARCSEHAYGFWRCPCGVSAKDDDGPALILFNTPDGIRCHTCMARRGES